MNLLHSCVPQNISARAINLSSLSRRLAALITLLWLIATPASAVTYSDNGDGTVTDPTTGLMWMRCSMGQIWEGNTCTGTVSLYTWNQANAVTGTVSFAGQSDWRLPNVRELLTIVDRSTPYPSINSAVFPNTPSTLNFWSATAHALYTENAWYVYFYSGYGDGSYAEYQNTANPIRLVRAGQPLALFNPARPTTDYVDHGDGTVTHTPTNLTWKRCSEGQIWSGTTCTGTASTFTWDAALLLSSTLGGNSDWHLPTADELRTLFDYTTAINGLNLPPAINSTVFPKTSGNYWSASPVIGDSGNAWSVYYSNGNSSGYYYAKGTPNVVRLVRGGQSFGNFLLIVAKTGTGTVSSTLADINCGSTCTASYDSGTKVVLKAISDWAVTWSGACSGTAATCTVNMTAAQNVTANFKSVPSTPGDFNGDGKADILWRNTTTGEVFQYQMNGTNVSDQGSVRTLSLDWKIVGTGDFNGDGKVDFLVRNVKTGVAYMYLLNGTAVVSEGTVRTVPLDWEVAGIGDFDGDGNADILWRNVATGALNIYFMNGSSVLSEATITTVSLESEVAAVADFNGDGKADIVFRNRAYGQFYVYLMNGANVISQAMVRTVSLDWELAGTGDFNGDGKADILWRNVTGGAYLYMMNGTSVSSEGWVRTVTPNWEVAQIGDFNGDGKADILWRNAKTGEAYAYLMNGTGVTSEASVGTLSTDWKTVAQKSRRKFKQTASFRGMDTNGDGKADILWRNASTGEVYYYQMNGSAVVGEGGIRTVSRDWEVAGYGDFNGDGKTDILWRNVWSGLTYVYLLNGPTVISEGAMRQVSLDWRVAAIGDFDGDGKDDILWRNVATGETHFYFLNGASVAWEAAGRTVTLDWEVAGAADFNGDGKADIVWRNIVTGATDFHFMDGPAVVLDTAGNTVSLDWELAGTGDFNGDGKADILWRNAKSGDAYVYLMYGANIVSQGLVRTVALDWEVAGIGDYNGDGRSDILWRALWDGEDYIYFLNGQAVITEGASRTVSLDWAADR